MSSSWPPALMALPLVAIPCVAMGIPGVMDRASRLARRPPAAIAAALLLSAPALVLLPAGGAARIAPAAAGLLAWALVPVAALLRARRSGAPPGPLDWLALAILALPALPATSWLWGGGAHGTGLARVTMACLLLLGFGAVRGLPGMGYRWSASGTHLAVASLAAAAVLLPAGALALAGALPAPPSGHPSSLPALLAALLFFALPDEILFRGILFNLLQRRLRGRHGPWPALLISAALFAAARLDPGSGGAWVQAGPAAIAGVAYGWCFLRSGSLVPGIAAHTAVLVVSGALHGGAA